MSVRIYDTVTLIAAGVLNIQALDPCNRGVLVGHPTRLQAMAPLP